MAKISELPLGNDLELLDEIPINRNGINVKVLGKDVLTTRLRTPQQISLSGAVVGNATFDGASQTAIETNFASLLPGNSNHVVIDDQSGLFKSRAINPVVWDTSMSPITGFLNAKYLPKAITPTALINSVIVESDLNHIGIRIQPTVELTVGGQISATDSISTNSSLSARENLYVEKHTKLGSDLTSRTVINGTALFPNASSSSLGVKIGGVGLYHSGANLLKIDGGLSINQLDISNLSNSVITEEGGTLKYRPINSQVWNQNATLIQGTGHEDFIPRYTSSNTIQDSIIYEKAAKIGIGTDIPNEKLTVNGTVSAVSLKIGNDYTPNSGIKFGNNVNLYRAANDVLRTDQNLIIGTIISDNTLNDVLVHDTGMVRQRKINSDSWDISRRIIRGEGTDLAIPLFGNDAVLRDSYMRQTASGDIEVSQKLFIGGSSGLDVQHEITKLKAFSQNGCSFYQIKKNDPTTSSNPNEFVSLFDYNETAPTRLANQSFISATNIVSLYDPADSFYLGSNISTSSIQSFLIKFRIKARLERPTGTVHVQFRRNGSESWPSFNSSTITLIGDDFSDEYRVYSSTNEIVYHDKFSGKFEWRLIDVDTNGFVAPFSPLNVSYRITAELLGFYFKLE